MRRNRWYKKNGWDTAIDKLHKQRFQRADFGDKGKGKNKDKGSVNENENENDDN